ncbi:P-loop NTPase fold protein [Aureivirga marina]|uniref:P-loop NTPase fold protein n=1 Tax=Aureivirga marina TaxID=1182451 RepID=UPI0018C976C0|nr:P-loop NTPase fold protein [Aureivirga marina]
MSQESIAEKVYEYQRTFIKYLKSIYEFCLEHKYIFIGTLIYVFFRKPFIDFWYKNIVKGKFDIFKETTEIYYVLILVFIFFLISFSLKLYNNHKYSQRGFIISTVVIGIIIYERLIGNAWIFHPSKNKIVFIDFIAFGFGLYFLGFLIQNKLKNAKIEINENDYEGFHVDEPISSEDDESLGRVNFAKQIAYKLEKTDAKENSFAVGIIGEWGSGKSSFMNLLKNELEGKQLETVINILEKIKDEEDEEKHKNGLMKTIDLLENINQYIDETNKQNIKLISQKIKSNLDLKNIIDEIAKIEVKKGDINNYISNLEETKIKLEEYKNKIEPNFIKEINIQIEYIFKLQNSINKIINLENIKDFNKIKNELNNSEKEIKNIRVFLNKTNNNFVQEIINSLKAHSYKELENIINKIKIVHYKLLNNENIIIEFKPWLNKDAKLITKDFFNTLSNSLKPFHSKLEHNIQLYIQLLLDSEVGGKSILKPIQTIIKSPKSVKEEFDIINNIISEIDRKIFIFIDDLDRLDKLEVIEVLRIIRNTANFKNVFFITAYDKEYVSKAVKEINEKHENYLEKIFQSEFPLPKFKNEYNLIHLEKLIIDRLKNQKSKDKLKESLNIDEEFNIFSRNHINTFRDTTRFSNSFITNIKDIERDIVIYDLLLIELLKIKYLDVYNLLFSNIKRYLEKNSEKRFFLKKESDDSNTFLIIKDYNTVDKNNSNPKIKDIIEILKYLFEENDILKIKEFRNDLNSIIYSKNIHRYINLRLYENDLSTEELEEILDLENIEVLEDKLNDLIINGKLNEIKNGIRKRAN